MLPIEGFSFKLSKVWTYWFVLLGLLISIIFGFIGHRESGTLAHWDNAFLDTYIKHTASKNHADNTVVIDIDEISLSAVGQWPWARYRMAALVQTIADNEPAAIGLDILFSEPDRTSLDNIKKTFKQDFDIDITFNGAPESLSDNDGYLGYVLSNTNTVGARYFYFDYTSQADTRMETEFHFDGNTDLLALNDAPGVLNNTHKIASQLKSNGFVNNQVDSDGYVRQMPLLIKHHDKIYPHLSLATYMRSIGVSTATIASDNHGQTINVGDHQIPISKDGFATLRPNGKSQLYPSIPAVEILNGSFDKSAIQGKIVFVGSSATGLSDLHTTIFDSHFPGLKLQSIVVENINNDNFIRQPSWGKVASFFATLITGILISLLFINFRDTRKLLVGPLLLALLMLTASFILFKTAGIFLSPSTPLVVIAILYTIFTSTRFLIEKKQAFTWYKKLSNARQVTMESMAAVAETRDPETGAHIKRTQAYVKAIAIQLRKQGLYTDLLTDGYINLLFASAPLHDIGKVGVPDYILLKPGKLTGNEFKLMKKHAEYGKDIINSTSQKVEGDNFLQVAGEIAVSHHEKWNGAGYPKGLSGHDIPVSGRIMAVADVYDALISKRCYKPAFSHEKATQIMQEENGKIFDPEILEAFFNIEDKIIEIAAMYQDQDEQVLGDR